MEAGGLVHGHYNVSAPRNQERAHTAPDAVLCRVKLTDAGVVGVEVFNELHRCLCASDSLASDIQH